MLHLRPFASGLGRLRARQSSASVLRLCRYTSSSAPAPKKPITIDGRTYQTDEWMNTPSTITDAVARRLHLQSNHPISITRQLIESRFPGFQFHNELFPVVSVQQNFDSLGFPADHPGRSRTDTYYLNKDTVLRTHTSAHQADTFRADTAAGYLISADVYRRDAVDRSHYPVFHQMEGARTWDRNALDGHPSLASLVWSDVEKLPRHDIKVEDPNPTFHAERNPLQAQHGHSPEEVEAIATHLKRSLENVVVEIFAQAKKATGATTADEPLRVRWVEAYFPFTSPSWELEVFWQDDWLEVLGCGVVSQPILSAAGVPGRLGWAFGLGLERIAMLLFGIPDIRLFWSVDPRFLSQFQAPSAASAAQGDWRITRFSPFSKHPAAPRDVAFWLPGGGATASASAAGGRVAPAEAFHDNDVMEIVREEAGDIVEDARCIDAFTHPRTGRSSRCYRVVYRSLERTLTSEEVNALHERIRARLVERLGVELR